MAHHLPYRLAVPLYLHTISLLVPPVTSPRKATREELCRGLSIFQCAFMSWRPPITFLSGAQLMSNLSELFMRSAPTSAALHQSEAWARQALSLLQKTQGNASQSNDARICEEALAVVLFNLGSLREVRNLPFPFAYARLTQYWSKRWMATRSLLERCLSSPWSSLGISDGRKVWHKPETQFGG